MSPSLFMGYLNSLSLDRQSLNTFTRSFLMGLSFLMAFVKGTYTTSSWSMPIMTLRCPSMMASMAAAPRRLARIRSCAVGLPPRCK